MHEVKVRRSHLLQKVEQNREDHSTELVAALAEYRVAQTAELAEALEAVCSTGPDVVVKAFRTALVEPPDHRKDYDRVISMLQMSVDETIVLDAQSFNRYVRDEWEWRDQFFAAVASTKAYLKG